MSAMQRLAKLTPPATQAALLQTSSPLILDHGTFVGLGLSLSNGAAVVTVAIDSVKTGSFSEVVTLEGTGTHRWPNADGMNRLYNAAFVKITWSIGTLRVFQKG